MDDVGSKYIEHIKEKAFVSSAKITDGTDEVTVSWTDRYSKIPTDQTDELKKIVGDKFDNLFQEVNNITVKPEVAGNAETLTKLIELVGAEEFAKYFSVEQFVKPTRRFTETRYADLDKKTNEKLSSIVKPYTPSVKVK